MSYCIFFILTQFCILSHLSFKSFVYIPGMKNREERSKHFFDSGPLMEEDEDLAVYDKVKGFESFINTMTMFYSNF